MKLSNHQKGILSKMNDGYVLKTSGEFGTSYWINKTDKQGYTFSETILQSTFITLYKLNLITLIKKDKYNHSIYKLSKYAIKHPELFLTNPTH